MQIILQEDVEKLGTRGEVVEVAAGYARNFLLPHKLALEASPANIKRLEKIRITLSKRTATEKEAAEQQAALLNNVVVKFTRKAGETDQLFGSVTSADPVCRARWQARASKSTSAASHSMSPSRSSAKPSLP